VLPLCGMHRPNGAQLRHLRHRPGLCAMCVPKDNRGLY
jgi:hypothetical protein